MSAYGVKASAVAEINARGREPNGQFSVVLTPAWYVSTVSTYAAAERAVVITGGKGLPMRIVAPVRG
jgi:hypothetical protein